MSTGSALAALVGPIKYATAKGFANLHAVKGLRHAEEAGGIRDRDPEMHEPRHAGVAAYEE